MALRLALAAFAVLAVRFLMVEGVSNEANSLILAGPIPVPRCNGHRGEPATRCLRITTREVVMFELAAVFALGLVLATVIAVAVVVVAVLGLALKIALFPLWLLGKLLKASLFLVAALALLLVVGPLALVGILLVLPVMLLALAAWGAVHLVGFVF